MTWNIRSLVFSSEGEAALYLTLASRGHIAEVQYCFAKPRRWKFDLAFPAKLLAVEVEGGTYSGGRHVRGKGFAADCEKYNRATELGWRVLRYTTEMVYESENIEQIVRMLEA